MNLRRLHELLIKSEEIYTPVDKDMYSKLWLYCYDDNEQFLKKLDIQALHISLDYNTYGRQLITVSFKVWWEDSNEYIKPNTRGSFTIRYLDPHKNEMVLQDALIKSICNSDEEEYYEIELFTNNMNYFTKELTHIKF